jgi:hypothetical protein
LQARSASSREAASAGAQIHAGKLPAVTARQLFGNLDLCLCPLVLNAILDMAPMRWRPGDDPLELFIV